MTLRYCYPWIDVAKKRLLVIVPPGATAQLAEMALGAGYMNFFDKSFIFVEHDGKRPIEVGNLRLEPDETQHFVRTWGFRISARGTDEDPDKVLAYSADAGPCPALPRIADGADLFLCEAALRSLQGGRSRAAEPRPPAAVRGRSPGARGRGQAPGADPHPAPRSRGLGAGAGGRRVPRTAGDRRAAADLRGLGARVGILHPHASDIPIGGPGDDRPHIDRIRVAPTRIADTGRNPEPREAPTTSSPTAMTSTIEPIMANPILAAVHRNQPSEWPWARPVSHSSVGPEAPNRAT